MKSQSIKALRNIQAKLDNGKFWTQGASARTLEGESVYPTHSSAMCWCIGGALECVEQDHEVRLYIMSRFLIYNNGATLEQFNDRNDYNTVAKGLQEMEEFV